MADQNFNIQNLMIGVVGLILVFGIIIFVIPDIIFEKYFNQRLDLLMSFSIGLFVIIEAFATHRQWVDSKLSRKSDLIREQLEKAFGPLYANLSYLADQESTSGTQIGENEFEIEIDVYYDTEVIQKVNEIFLKYPYMFDKELYDLWQTKIRYYQKNDPNYEYYPEEFVSKCLEAYRLKLEEYQSFSSY